MHKPAQEPRLVKQLESYIKQEWKKHLAIKTKKSPLLPKVLFKEETSNRVTHGDEIGGKYDPNFYETSSWKQTQSEHTSFK